MENQTIKTVIQAAVDKKQFVAASVQSAVCWRIN